MAPQLTLKLKYKNSVEFQMEIKIIFRRGFDLQTTHILLISRCYFEENG